MTRERLQTWLDKAERPLLALAALAVGLYLADLTGAWNALGVGGLVNAISFGLDILFVVDLFLKIVAGGRAYLATPWFVVDLVCAIPILASTSLAPKLLEGLRFVRMVRLLRALRLLRTLRSMRVLRGLSFAISETRESKVFDRVLRIAVLVYAVIFISLVTVARSGQTTGEVVAVEGRAVSGPIVVTVVEKGITHQELLDPTLLVQNADRTELWFVAGSLLGMALILVVSQYQMPAAFSKQIRAFLNVALPRQVADWFMAHPDSYSSDVRMPATVVFCDIKGFTAASESMPLEELKVCLEQALDIIVDAHMARDLIVDKFIGDAVMSFRGGNLVTGTPEDHAYRVVRGGLDGAMTLAKSDIPHFNTVKLGCASSPNALIGTFGTSKRLSYTILGDRVNLASRLEGACNALGVRSLLCDLTRNLVGDQPDLVWRQVGMIRVAGKSEAYNTWEVFDADEPVSWIPAFHHGLKAWDHGDFHEAAQAFHEADAERPGGDALSRIYLARIASRTDDDPTCSRVIETRK